jgi:hypothetical protein
MSGQTQYACSPSRTGVAHARDHVVASFLCHELRRDRRAARRQLVDHRDVQVGVVRHRERSRDRCRAHHELVRLDSRLPARGEGKPLLDAEAVLLVDDREPEFCELHAFLEERVRADRELDLARGDGLHGLLLLAALQRARKPRDLHAQGCQPVRELEVMLLGEDFRRRHECRLPAVLDRLERGHGGHQRLAAAHVALQQAAHRVRVRKVLADRGVRGALGARERERQRLHERVGERVRLGQGRCGLRAPFAIGDAHGELLREDLVELEPPPRRMRAVVELLRGNIRWRGR